ncbi:phospholipase D-like domain-containing protein [Falsirhodobacter halotolerans]|uniref:phospholipase D-like domain-containing protein n=1 Tax=Falsirhodobacter halotolerans TaxID=1146892 RepID=UPI001FD5D1B4|nr:phosphatidylserine/phosphatidylglycerophosphate/cardiolipin synthase family protein [Falsirhodobacter halotolerans]MCJ8140751.1 phosphatidylserine/phosphatidylglycerophosphate/cardiolipin synthase family protein [Falsirhodobacter halotolerans]
MIAGGLSALIWGGGTVVLFAALSVLTWWSYGRWAARARGPYQAALPLGDTTALDRRMGPMTDAHPGQSGVLPLIPNREGFAARIEATRAAGRSLDVMSYLWYLDQTGWWMIQEVTKAANRGVRVRILLDDVNVQGLDRTFLALNQHPNIEVRLFNPIRSRGHVVRRMTETLLGLARFNRRMHGKMWIADGRLAIIGGRNIGDTYFGAVGEGGLNSRDLDVAVAGPAVGRAEEVFDAFWNLGLSLPILTLVPRAQVSNRAFRRRIRRHTARKAIRADLRALPGDVLARPFRFDGGVEFVADPPDKVFKRQSDTWLIDRLPGLLDSAERRFRIVTPYFVPGRAGLAQLVAMAERGVQVQIVTNALCNADNMVVYGAYARYRPALLRAGVELYEYAPPPRGDGKRDLLHMKLFKADGREALVGSVNYDLRSAFLNTETGVMISDPRTMDDLDAMFEKLIAPEAAFRLEPHGRRHRFRVERGGQVTYENADPGAGSARRLASWVVGRLPIQTYL